MNCLYGKTADLRRVLGYSIIFSLLSVPSFAQEDILLRGRVLDLNTYQEIAGVNIYVKGAEFGTSSGLDGRYSLRVPSPEDEMVVLFKHIAYEPQEIPIQKVKSEPTVYLQPRVIPMRELQVEAGRRLEIEQDLPQTISVIDASDFEMRGFIDAADVLRSDQSIQVEEELSGKKTISIRAGNPDDVVVLYNGIKMNSTYNNVFDLSLVDLGDIDHIEIIRGSNTALYGAEAFSGIINIVPRVKQNYTIKLQQRFGTYNSGDWGVHLYKGFRGLNGYYSFGQGGTQRRFIDEELLENKSLHHTANLLYDFSWKTGAQEDKTLMATLIQSSQQYDDHRDNENLSDLNEALMLQYEGDVTSAARVDLSVARHKWQETQSLLSSAGTINRSFEDHSLNVNTGVHLNFSQADLFLKYQFEDAALGFEDKRTLSTEQSVGLESATLLRRRQGIVSILKFHTPTSSNFIKVTDFDISFRRDKVIDEQLDPVFRDQIPDPAFGLAEQNVREKTTFRISSHFSGGREDQMFDVYMNYGTNIKFPTLFQQVSSPEIDSLSNTLPNLNPEENTALEIGFELAGDIRDHPVIYGYQFTGSLFRNNFENKLRVSFPIGIPVAFYDNVVSAKLSGFESKLQLFLYKKKVSIDIAVSLYSISDKAAFPFKSDKKFTSNIKIDHAGYSFQLHGFKESEQTGWIRHESGEFSEAILPEHSNIDVHLSKTFEWRKLKIFINMSGRNLLNRDIVLQGLALRDRRIYLTLGTQF